MKYEMNLYYDEESDFLEIQLGEHTEGYFRDIEEGIAERIDEKTGKVTGIAIMSFRKRTKNCKELAISLSLPADVLA